MNVIGDQAGVGQMMPDRFGNGAADQAKPDKTAGESVYHVSTS